MKDQDNKTNATCYCKNNTPLEQVPLKDAEKLTSVRSSQNKIDAGTKQPWSMFEGWYWL